MLDDPDDRPGRADVLASLVRTAIARRNIDTLPPLLGDWSSVEGVDAAALEPAHVGDGGRRANPLWASWVTVHQGPALERLAERLRTPEPPSKSGSQSRLGSTSGAKPRSKSK